MAINLKNAPDIILEEPGSAFKEVAGTVFKGIISDIFYQARQDRRNQQATLWEGYKLDGEMAIKMQDPEKVEDAISKINIRMSDASIDDTTKSKLGVWKESLGLHLEKIQKDMPSQDIKDATSSFKQTFANAKGGSPEYLKEVIGRMEDKQKGLIDNYANPNYETINLLDKEFDIQEKEFENKLYDESGNVRMDLTEDEAREINAISASLTSLSDSIQQELAKGQLRGSEPDKAISFFRNNNDKESAKELEILSGQIRILKEEKNKADSIKEWNTSVNDVREKLADGKKNPEGFGKLMKEYLDELTEKANENAFYLQKSHFDMLDDLNKDAQVINSSLNILERIDYINKQGGYSSDIANDYLLQSKEEAFRAYTTEDKGAITKSLTFLNSAISSENAYNKGVAQSLKTAKKQKASSTKALLSTASSKISESFGKGPKGADAKRNYDSSYLEGGSFEINQNPGGMLTGFNIDTPSNLNAYKLATGENVAKLVLSSDLEGIKNKEEAKELAIKSLNLNLSSEIRASALDELYNNHLKISGVDLDFAGLGNSDSAAQNLYSQYKEMYRILYETGIEASTQFGDNYSEDFIQQYGKDSSLDSLTQEDLTKLF